MSADSRFELLERVGMGSFATVYRARDTELGREVAIKQIHQQYLELPGQMDRYWKEAQLLAQLQHPNIITFYDIDRQRGWLIMELMQGNLSDRITTAPLDLKSVRTSLAHCLRALKYLHAQGIVHGDIKPGNMMIDSRKRIKLGDFGLARRVSDADGSLLKGTTKYMAPETVAEEFGDVGPGSDLYSLGFAAYELMCGPNFEKLFPGLGAFGRDKQIAWMMWHAAVDRRLPEVSRVLEGVPDDLARVIDRLVQKDQSQRYQSADEALSDLQIDVRIVKTGNGETLEEEPGNRRRVAAIAAFCASLILSAIMLFSGGETPQQDTTVSREPVEGVVGHVDADEGFFVVIGADGVPADVQFGSRPKILLNDKSYITARELQPDDRVRYVIQTDDAGRESLEMTVSRPVISTGYVVQTQPSNQEFTLQVTEGANRSQLIVRTNDKTRVLLNGAEARFGQLKADDEITVHHVPYASVAGIRLATSMAVLQKRSLQGFVRDLNDNGVTVEVNRQGQSELVRLPVASECEVTINGRRIVDGRLLKASDLQAGDRVTVTHHSEVLTVHALRQFLHKGVLLDLQAASSTIITSDSESGRKVFVAANDCQITINGESAELNDLRRNDRLELTFDSTSQQNDVSAIDALRPVVENRFAIVIGNQNYDDNTLSAVKWAAADAKLLYDTLLSRYGCSPERTLLLVDETRVRLEQAVPDWLRRTDENSQLLVFVAGHAYADADGQPWLAAKDFDLSRISQSGIALKWLREQIEACPAREKILLLDCSREGEAVDLNQQPSSAVMLNALQPKDDPAVFRTTWAIAASTEDQRGLDWDEKQHGVFAAVAAEAFSGRGDRNADVHLEPTELFDYLASRMAAITIDKQQQTPRLYRPDATPPPMDRISPEGREAIRNLLASHWSERRRLPAAAEVEFLAASRAAGDEPDVRLAWALLQMKIRNDRDARKYFDQVRLSNPELFLSYDALAWMDAYDGRFSAALASLTARFARTLVEQDSGNADSRIDVAVTMAAGLREFAEVVAEPARRPGSEELSALDSAVAALGDAAAAKYDSARRLVRDKAEDYDRQIKAEDGSNAGRLLELERNRLTSYVDFDYEAARTVILNGLEK